MHQATKSAHQNCAPKPKYVEYGLRFEPHGSSRRPCWRSAGRDRTERSGAGAVARLGRQHRRVPEDAVCGLPGIDVTHAREPTTIDRRAAGVAGLGANRSGMYAGSPSAGDARRRSRRSLFRRRRAIVIDLRGLRRAARGRPRCEPFPDSRETDRAYVLGVITGVSSSRSSSSLSPSPAGPRARGSRRRGATSRRRCVRTSRPRAAACCSFPRARPSSIATAPARRSRTGSWR